MSYTTWMMGLGGRRIGEGEPDHWGSTGLVVVVMSML